MAVLGEVIARRELLRDDQAVGLREEDQRVCHYLLVPFDPIVAHTPVPGHVDAEDQDVALAGVGGTDHRFDYGYGGAHAGRRPGLVDGRLVDARLPGRDLEHCLAGDLVDRVPQRRAERGVGRAQRAEDRHPEDDPERGQDVTQEMAPELRQADLSEQRQHGLITELARRPPLSGCGRRRPPPSGRA